MTGLLFRAMTRAARRLPARSLLAAALVLALGAWEPFRSADPDVEAGNRAYTEGRYDDALAAYDRAARRGSVDGDGLAFDRGTVLLRKADATHDPAEKQRLTARALEDLKQAGHARDPRIRGNASYNRGNLLMGQDKLDDAIEAYKQALRDDADLDDARLNLELALRRRDQQRKQQQSKPGQGQRGQGQGRQPDPGQGQNQSPDGNGSSDDQGSNQQGSSGGDGSGQPQSGNGQGSSQSPSSGGDGANRPQGGANGQGSNAPQSGSGQRPSDRPDRSPVPQRGRPQRGRPQSPRTPTDGALDDLDNYSRRLQKDGARRHATGRPVDPQHDW